MQKYQAQDYRKNLDTYLNQKQLEKYEAELNQKKMDGYVATLARRSVLREFDPLRPPPLWERENRTNRIPPPRPPKNNNTNSYYRLTFPDVLSSDDQIDANSAGRTLSDTGYTFVGMCSTANCQEKVYKKRCEEKK